ncbi:low molecular weight protein-tyrosine-phosphatase [Paraburkholderia sp. BCC1885]|uniref:low molecular weight protein-tyrosine-phosphatase n=1 Tax=Paraburkholderia sp. BCC1885 TaxID=2562669 RepID=UPI0011825B7C|nr:low molecular weight protein-tyrosine-phosphatase [Paraburkholderia sp. BCC1885]
MIGSVLTVCTGNLCRSPMAMGLLGQTLQGVRVTSAGVHAQNGTPVDPVAAHLLRECGIDLSGHRARCLDRAMLEGVDLILVMEHVHQRHIEREFPTLRGKVHRLWRADDVPDPYGKGLVAYEEVMGLIAASVGEWATRINALRGKLRSAAPDARPSGGAREM